MIAFAHPENAPRDVPAETSGRDCLAPSAPIPTDTEQLGDEIARLAAHINAATHRLLVLIREFDAQEGWGGGFLSCAHWLSWRTGIAPGAAREKVRVARALGTLPQLSGAMARGELSYSKLRALTRVATPANESELLEVARHATAAHIEKLVRVWRSVDRQTDAQEERERHQSRYLRLHPDDDGMWRLEGRLDPEVGALLEKALEWAGDALYRQEHASPEAETSTQDAPPRQPAQRTPFAQRRADALGLLADRWMSMGETNNGEETATDTSEAPDTPAPSDPPVPLGRADRFQVVVHVEAEELKQDAEGCGAEIGEGGMHVSAETSRRLACEASVVRMVHGASGEVLDVGRKTRTVPPAIRRALDHRDKGCRFPGCGLRYTDAHHIVHWSDGGDTKLDNLVLLCRRHHRLVHEGGFRVEVGEVSGNEHERSESEGGCHRKQAPACGGGSRPQMGCERRQRIRFLRPDGASISDVPMAPVVRADPVGAMEEENAARGVHPTAWTATPRWNGEVLDLGMVLDGLMPLGE